MRPASACNCREEADALAPLFARGDGVDLGAPDLLAAQRAPEEQRSVALAAITAEIERMMLGWDVNPPRFDKMLEFLEAPLPDGLSESFRLELTGVRQGLLAFVDVEQLFTHNRRSRKAERSVRRTTRGCARTCGACTARAPASRQDFLDMLQAALRHYDIETLDHNEDLERAMLRMFASQRDPSHRRRLVMAVLRRLIALVNSGISLSEDEEMRDALMRIAAMRGEISNALADTALEAHYRAYQGVEMARYAESTTRDLERWLAAAESAGQTPSPPAEVLEGLATAPALGVRARRRAGCARPIAGSA